MEIFVEQALTYTECLNKIRTKYGDRITIMHYKNIRIGGFLGLFAKDGVEITGFVSNNALKPGTFQGGGTFPQAQNPPGQTDQSRKPSLNFEEEKKKILDASPAKGESLALQQVLKEVKELKQQVTQVTATALISGPAEKHSTIGRIEEILNINDFSPQFTQNILDRIKKEFSLDALNDYTAVQDSVLEWIGENVKVYKEEPYQRLPRIMVLVGPTGVGKTTTIAKLAAIYGLGNSGRRPISVRMITIDAFR
ncbi:MAG: flagellar biosynthesis protein FlhF, partial [Spirochaetaceae bacterium]|nr:flagellar biosynthesis protein FlhF [Spirochaetaceae bacterium]